MTGEGTHKDTETFQIASLQEAEDFAAYISRYGEATSSGYDIRDHIRNIYKYSRVHSTSDRINGKLLNAYIDLELTYLFMMKDSLLAGGTHNRLHDSGKTALGSVLDDFELFLGKWIFYIPYRHSLSEFALSGTSIWESCFCSMKIKTMSNTSRHEAERSSLFDALRNGRKFRCIYGNA